MAEWVRKSVRGLSPYVPGEQPGDSEVTKLNTNENPYWPTPAVRDVLSEIDVETLARYPDPECAVLREAIARMHGCAAENVFVGNGSDEVLALCVRAFVEREGGTVGWFEPSYSLYPALAAIEDVATKPVSLGEDFGWRMPEDYAASLFFLTNPNAPTSLLFPRERVEAFARGFSGVTAIDEAYADFAGEDCADLALELPNVLVTRTLSKAYSLAGIRLGYALGSAELIGALFKIKDSYNVDRLTQEIALAAIRDGETMRANVEAILETRRLATERLREMGFDVADSRTNFLWIRPPEGISAERLFASLRERKVLVRHFGDDERTRSHLRVTIGTAPETFRFLDATAEILGISNAGAAGTSKSAD